MQKQNNIQNKTSMCEEMLNGSDDSGWQSLSRESQSHPVKMEGPQFWNPRWDINKFALNKELFLKKPRVKYINVACRRADTRGKEKRRWRASTLTPQGRPFEKIQEDMFSGKAPWLCRDLPKHLVNIKETTFLLSNTAEREWVSLCLLPKPRPILHCSKKLCYSVP